MLHFARWKIILILAVIATGAVFSVPNLFPLQSRFEVVDGQPVEPLGVWRFLPNNTINLGLDLQGGSHLVFEVDLDQVRADRLNALADDARAVLRRQPAIPAAPPAVVGGEVVVRISRADDLEDAYRRLNELSQPIQTGLGQGGFGARTAALTRDPADNIIRIRITTEALEDIRHRTVSQSIEVVRRRIDGLGTTEPTIARQGDNRVLVQVPGESDPQRIIDLVGATARMTFHMVDASVDPGPTGQARTPPGVMVLRTERGDEPYLAVQRRALVSGENLTNASVTTQDGQVVVAFRFDTIGARAFGEATARNVGRRFAIVLDDIIISAPVIESPILGGSGIIRGNFTFQSANDLAVLLNAGALPAQLTPVEQRTVGPGLGQDSIDRGSVAVVVGFLAVMVFMLVAYGLFGIASVMALLTNVVLILGALTGLQATLTLPGIAGIILTIGMAVDANVLIFERIREEVRAGRSPANAIDAGYSNALSAILDANITTLIAAGTLFMLGAGPVRGFAVTLGIGIMTSVFTAFVFTRLLVAAWFRATRAKKLPI
ncbi:MAG: protein translocase subunit SecD [Maricaulaceae bacterium]|nr:protein translocase subunit SecD [Maricaulaceae bacterium]